MGGDDTTNLREWLGRMEAKLDRVTDELAAMRAQWAIRPCERHDERIRVLEQHRWASLGIVGFVASLPGILALIKLFS